VGLVRHGHRLLFAKKGFLWWAPYPVKSAISKVWNSIACWRYGHDILDYRTLGPDIDVQDMNRVVCTDCCKEFTRAEYDLYRRRPVAKLLRRNLLGKQGVEGWGDFLAQRWAELLCRIFGHAMPLKKMSGDICSRCRIMLKK